MENGFELLYLSFGVILFICAITAFIAMDNSFKNSYRNVLYKSYDSSVIVEFRRSIDE